MDAEKIARTFFDRYAAALLDRNATQVAGLYAVPALILFPGNAIAVSDSAQTEAFFSTAWNQYEGVSQTSTDINVVAEAGHSIWADVTWSHDGTPAERFIYQLITTDGQWKIAVLTPMDL